MKPTILFLLLFLQQTTTAEVFKANSYQAQYHDVKSVSHGDINGDGFNDIAVATDQKGNVLLYLNDQNNGFKVQILNLIEPRYIDQIDLADMNGDGKLDLLVLSTETSEEPVTTRPFPTFQATSYLEVYINHGLADFEMTLPYISFVTLGSGVAFRVADFNQDGRLDIIKSDSQSTLINNSFQTYLYSGDENEMFTATSLDINLKRSTQLADYNLDGYLDLWNLSDSPEVYIFEPGTGFLAANKQSVVFSLDVPSDPNTLNPTMNSYSDVSLADLDGDGDIDVQAFEYNGVFLRFLKEGNQFIQTATDLELPLPFSQLSEYQSSKQYGGLIDLENDGKPETWMASSESENVIIIGDLFNQPEVQLISSNKINKFGSQAVIDDFNADGRPDVVSIGSNGLVFWQNLPNQQMLSQQTKDGRWGRKHILKTGDMNADGHVDMVLAGQDGIAIKYGNGFGSFSVVENVSNQEVTEILPVDLNGDGKKALLGVNLGSIFKWQKNQNPEQSMVFEDPTGAVNNLQSIDYNDDGLIDLVYLNGDKQLLVSEQRSAGYLAPQWVQDNVDDFKVIKYNQQAPELLVYLRALPETFTPGFLVMGFDQHLSPIIKQVINKTDLPLEPDVGGGFGFHPSLKLADMDLDGDQDVVVPFFRGDESGLVWLNKVSGSWQGELLRKGDSDLLPFALEYADFNGDGYLDVFAAKPFYSLNGSQDDIDYISLGSPTGLQQSQLMSFDLRTRSSELVDIDGDNDLDLLQVGHLSAIATQLNTTNDIDFSGLWFNPTENGHGLQLEQIDLNGMPAVNFSWFAFQNGQPFWLVGVAPLAGNTVSIPVIYTDGADFFQAFDPADVNVRPWGQVELTLNDNDLSVSWETTEVGFIDGSLSMQRLTTTKATTLATDVINSCHSGSWFNSTQSGHGFFVNVIESQGKVQMTLAWYHYLAGAQKWLVAQGPVFGSQAFLSAQAGTGSQFPPLHDSTSVEFSDWGQVNFTLLTDSTAKISWASTTEDYPTGDLLVEKLTTLDRYHCAQ